MKKLLLVFALFTLFSCSKDDDNKKPYGLDCDDKVFGYVASPDGSGGNNYSLYVGYKSNDYEVIPATLSSFQYYQDKSESFTKVICYDGPK